MMRVFLAANPVMEAYYQSDFLGKGIFIFLFFLSIVTWGVFLQKWWLQKKAKEHARVIENLFAKNKHNPLGLDPDVSPSPFVEIYRSLKVHTLELLNKNKRALNADQHPCLSRSDIDLIDGYLLTTISHETKKMEKNLFILSTVVSLAPFLGLLGTVWGILTTFAELQLGAAANTNAAVMGGLSTALGTTVLGLIVAIPALISYNYLRSSVAHLSTDMEDFSHTLLASVELHYRQVDIHG